MKEEELREKAAKSTLDDIVAHLGGFKRAGAEALGNQELAKLLRAKFDELDKNQNGISRDELIAALADPNNHTVDEYAMLRLLARYFDTVAEMSDDEPGADRVVTATDREVLCQFLLNSDMTLADLHSWMDQGKMTPPPLTSK